MNDQSLLEGDQTLSEADQTAADLDQNASDADQGASESDQQLAKIDQPASDRDQAASDSELVAHPEGSPVWKAAHDASRHERDETTIARESTALARSETATARAESAISRDHTAHLRDLAARARDEAADTRDQAAADRVMRFELSMSPRDRRLHEAALSHVAAVRENALAVRGQAATDRANAASDRDRVARDREAAAADRAEAEAELRRAHLDHLTGTYSRGMGRVALQNEIDRARRGDGKLTFAYVDVNGLKDVNDRLGHAAGDSLLKAVAQAMRSRLRSYEPVVRLGGDEFVCALSGLDLAAADRRFDEIRRSLDQDHGSNPISVGFATLEETDSLDDVLERADAGLVRTRRN